jgi:hypothetical protein
MSKFIVDYTHNDVHNNVHSNIKAVNVLILKSSDPKYQIELIIETLLIPNVQVHYLTLHMNKDFTYNKFVFELISLFKSNIIYATPGVSDNKILHFSTEFCVKIEKECFNSINKSMSLEMLYEFIKSNMYVYPNIVYYFGNKIVKNVNKKNKIDVETSTIKVEIESFKETFKETCHYVVIIFPKDKNLSLGQIKKI